MSDTYISKVTSIEPEPTAIHRCGAISFNCEVESPMYDGAYWCPICKCFWAIDEDCWHDKDTVFEVEMPKPEIAKEPIAKEIISKMVLDQKIRELEAKVVELKKTEAELRDTIRRYNELVEELHEMYGADNEVLNAMETRILGEAE